MLLTELKTPYHKMKVVAYTGNTPSIKSITLQHISGVLYKTREKVNSTQCGIYTYYEEHKTGIYIEEICYADKVTVDELLAKPIYGQIKDIDGFIAMTQQNIKNGWFVNMAAILFIEHVAPDMGASCREARAAFLAKAECEDRERKEKYRMEEERKVSENNAAAAKQLIEAISKMKSSGTVKQGEITLYRDWYDNTTYASIFNLLFYIYKVDVPINVRGWVNKWLRRIIIQNGKLESLYRNINHPSKTCFGYLAELIKRISADVDNTVLRCWLEEKGIPYPETSEQAA